MKIVHIITGLNNGGAEAVLYRLSTADRANKHIIVSLIDEGKYGSLLRESRVDVYTLNFSSRRLNLSKMFHLYKLIKKLNPDIVQTWMYHSDLIGGCIARLAGVKNIFWNIRHSNLDKEKSKFTTRLIAKICAWLSPFVPKKIVCCAEEAKEVHEKQGYQSSKLVVIPNGYDHTHYYYDKGMRQKFRAELSIDDNCFLIGMVARYVPEKDHINLFNAISLFIKKTHKNFKLCLVGKGLNSNNQELVKLITDLKLEEYLILLDQRSDISKVMNGIDIHVLSSSTEGFPNVVAEAMACGTPCISTDVGDASLIIGDLGWLVPKQDSLALTMAILDAMEQRVNEKDWQNRRVQCEQKIKGEYSLDSMVRRYENIWFDQSRVV